MIEELDPLVQKAIERQFISVHGNQITYHASKDKKYDLANPEEKVRAYVFSWLVIEKNYPTSSIDLEVQVPRRTPSDFADIVVFETDSLETPYLVVETKKPSVQGPKWTQGIEQGFGNANSLRDTKYLLIDNYEKSKVYDVQGFPPTERQRNILGSRARLPRANQEDISYRLVAGGDLDIQPSSSTKLEAKIRRAHAEIWSGGKRDPLASFDEWSKLLFAKIYDERHTEKGQHRRFQIGLGEPTSQAANRIHNLFQAACDEDPTVFKNASIQLREEKLCEVAQVLEEESFTGHDLDVLGHAFEEFFGEIFRGQLGQYFTRRELTRFMVSVVNPTANDFILDPTVGSGGFLLEALFQVWYGIEERYTGPEVDRIKYDFAHGHLFGIEIHPTLARICKTNLILHKDGHTNIEGDRSCLDTTFSLPRLDSSENFDVILGNPPFGDKIKRGDRDRLGDNSLDEFELLKGESLKAEFAVVERSLDFLKPGGRLGFVIPDGMLNNASERSNCPQFRRFLLRKGKILGIVSLPEHAFHKAGAQNKTSILFFQKYSEGEQRQFQSTMDRVIEENGSDWNRLTGSEKWQLMKQVVVENDYRIFLAEAEEIGYSPSGKTTVQNDLYTLEEQELPNREDDQTILGQYAKFNSDPDGFESTKNPHCLALDLSTMIEGREDGRLDPKYHIFQHESLEEPPSGMQRLRLGDALTKREETITPSEYPNRSFIVPTIHQDGTISQREAGKHHAPVSWEGSYFEEDKTWHVTRKGDLLFSRIDLWKGSVTVVPEEFDQAITTNEFPSYIVDEKKLDPHFLQLLLRSKYFQRAIRAITTGHSNRRRTQEEDFEDLEIFVPRLETQRTLAARVEECRAEITRAEINLKNVCDALDDALAGEIELADSSVYTDS